MPGARSSVGLGNAFANFSHSFYSQARPCCYALTHPLSRAEGDAGDGGCGAMRGAGGDRFRDNIEAFGDGCCAAFGDLSGAAAAALTTGSAGGTYCAGCPPLLKRHSALCLGRGDARTSGGASAAACFICEARRVCLSDCPVMRILAAWIMQSIGALQRSDSFRVRTT